MNVRILLSVFAAVSFLPAGVLGSEEAAAPSVESVRELLAAHGITPLEEPPEFSEAKLKLGQALFFDPLIGGNRDVSCATCHHPDFATTDGRSRSVGTTAYDSDGKRLPVGFSLVEVSGRDPVLAGFSMSGAAHPFTPRNAPDCFNRGDSEWRTMFWDSRVHKLDDGRIVVNQQRMSKSPGEHFQVIMPDYIESVLAAQAMLPVTSDDEMRGTKGETDITGQKNEVGQVLGQNEEEIWEKLMDRVLAFEEYRELFREVFPDTPQEELHFAHAANAIAAFEIDAFTLLDSPWDRFLAGDNAALDAQQLAGAQLFYGKARCVDCHEGRLMTDQDHHNIGIIPIGPGPDPEEDIDFGLAHRSNAGLDKKFHFRTPPLRNVELTGPWMHNGAYTTLEGAVRQQIDPIHALENYDKTQLEPEFRGAVHDDPEIIKDVKSTLSPKALETPELTEVEFESLMAFLKSLTSPSARDLSHTIPESVPSGLKMVKPVPDSD